MPLNFDLTKLALKAMTAIGATTGHFGIDVIVPDDGSEPVVVEINPRLTTSYLGYRELMTENVAERILFPSRFGPTIATANRLITYDANGSVSVVENPTPAEERSC